MSVKILAVEDSDQYLKMIEVAFAGDTLFELSLAKSADEAIRKLESEYYDCFILDVGLPDMDGFQLCSFIKSHPNYSGSPVIFLTGHDSIEDKEKGFNIGGNDYLTKPFHVRELVLRVKSLTQTKSSTGGTTLKIGSLVLNFESHRVVDSNTQEAISLTKTEFQLLSLFGQHLDKVISRAQLLDTVWPDKLDVSERTVDSHISNLRKKVSGHGITLTSIHSSGYRMEAHRAKAS